MELTPQDFPHIKGWGIDADPENDPTYPMKNRTNEEHQGYSWDRPAQQPLEVEVLHSIERPNTSAIFGTTSPPSGLSGMIRRQAFNYSESDYRHWLPLILADRVNMVEGLVSDVASGIIPNIFAEKGWGVEWKHNRPALVRRVMLGVVVTGAIVALFNRNSIRGRR